MKKILFFGTLLVFSTGCVRKSELVKTQGELAALQEKIRLLERQRVPKADLDQAEAVVVAAREKMETLEQELKGTRDQLAAAQERVSTTERLLSLQGARAPETAAAPGLVKGTYTLMDDTIVYSADAQLNFGNGVMISSPTGMMLSDKDRAIVAGDLVIETPRETVQATHAFTEPAEGKLEAKADSASIIKK